MLPLIQKSACARQVRKTNEITVNSQTRFYTSLYQTPKRATHTNLHHLQFADTHIKPESKAVSVFSFHFQDQCLNVCV